MNENDKFALVPRPQAALEKAEPGAKRILSGMVAETLALAKKELPKTARPLRIVVLDSDERMLDLLGRLTQERFEDARVLMFLRGAEALRELVREQPDLFITNWAMLDVAGPEVLHFLARRKAPFPVIVISSHVTEEEVRGYADPALNVTFLRFPFPLPRWTEVLEATLKIPLLERSGGWTPASGLVEDAASLCERGEAYYYGKGLPQDYTEAARWIRSAAERGHARAQYLLGECYDNRFGVPEDLNEAVKWFRKAAEQGNADAQNYLGSIYLETDAVEAVKWLRRAAEQGFAEAQTAIGDCYLKGIGVAVDIGEAAGWFRKAAQQGHAHGQVQLGRCYEAGRGVPKDEVQAAKWYHQAAQQNISSGALALAICFEKGLGVKQDSSEAIKWLRKAAAHADADAQDHLGSCYERGQGVPQDHDEAVKWYGIAAKNYASFASLGNAWGQAGLGRAYSLGRGVPQDMPEAYKWFRLAAKQGDKRAADDLALLSSTLSPEQLKEGERRSQEYERLRNT